MMPAKLKILLVDDEDTLRKIMKDELVVQGYDVSDAESGKAALDILKKGRHDIVILDIRMDGMDGLEVLKHIRKDDLANKVIMLTGVDELKIAKDSLELGANDFMTKPFQFQNLFACIKRVMKEA
jgi:DNA-binding response OmpR family regulator